VQAKDMKCTMHLSATTQQWRGKQWSSLDGNGSGVKRKKLKTLPYMLS
jgi:hypothetical protein